MRIGSLVRWSITSPAASLSAPTLAGLVLSVGVAAVILTLPFPLNLAAAPAIAAGIAYLRYPPLGPLLLIASVPVQTVGAASLGGVGLTATRATLLAAVAACAIHLITRRESIRWSVIVIPFVAYILTMVVSLRAAHDLRPALSDLYSWLVALFAFMAVLYAVRTRRAVLALVALMGLGAVAEGFLGTVQSILALGPASFAIGGGISRAFGTFGKPNTYAGYLEMTGPLLLTVGLWSAWQALSSLRRYRRLRLDGMHASRHERHQFAFWVIYAVWLGAGAALSLGGIVASFSRGAWLGVAAAAAAMMIVAFRRVPIVPIALIGLAALFVLAGGMRYTPGVLQARYEQIVSQVRLFDSRRVQLTDANFASVERMAMWQAGIGMFESSPITGIGAGNYNARYQDFYVRSNFRFSAGHAHNYYIQAAAETGILGLLTYLALIGTALTTAVRAARSAPTGLGRAIGVGAVGVTVAVMVHNVVEDLHVLNLGVQLAAVWALAVIALRYLPAHETTAATRQEAALPE